MPAIEQIPTGVKEGALSGLNALIGRNYQGSPIPEEYGASAGRQIGQMAGQSIPAAGVGALTGGAGTALASGIGKTAAGLIGTGIGWGGTTQGNALDRGIAGAEAAGLHGGFNIIKALTLGKVPMKRIWGAFKTGNLKELLAENESQLAKAHANHEISDEQYKAYKDYLAQKPEFGEKNTNALIKEKNSLMEEKPLIEEQLSQHPESQQALMPQKPLPMNEFNELDTLKPNLIEPEPPKKPNIMDFEKLEKPTFDKEAIEYPEIPQEQAPHAENLLKTEQQKLAEAENAVNEGLMQGQAHRKVVGEKVNEALEKNKVEIGDEYKKFKEDLKEKDISLKNKSDAMPVINNIEKLLKSGNISGKVRKSLEKKLSKINSSQSVPANDFVSAYRTLRKYGQKVRREAYGKPQQEFENQITIADSIDEHVAKMEDILNKGLEGEPLKELHRINARYKNERVPLFEDAFHRTLQKQNMAPANMITNLAKEPFIAASNPYKATGTGIIRKIIKSDPELLKHVVGERFTGKPNEWHKLDAEAHEYISEMPEHQINIAKHKQALQDVEKAKTSLEKAKQLDKENKIKADEQHKENIKYAKMQHKEHLSKLERENLESNERIKQRNTKEQEEAEQYNLQKKQETEQKNEQEKEKTARQNELNKREQKRRNTIIEHQKRIEAIDKRIPKLEEHIAELQKRANTRKMNLKEKMHYEKEVSRIKDELKQAKADRKITLKIIAATATTGSVIQGINYAIHKLGAM